MIEFLKTYGLVIGFYGIILLLLYINRNKFDRQARFIFLYKTKIGIKLMKKWSHPKSDWAKLWGPRILFAGTSILLAGLAWNLSARFSPYSFSSIAIMFLTAAAIFYAFYHIKKTKGFKLFSIILAIIALWEFIGSTLTINQAQNFGAYLLIAGFLIFVISLFFRPIKQAGEMGIWVGYAGMITILGFIVYGFFALFLVPDSPPVVSPVIPGVPIPGSPIQVPLVAGWIALFVAIVVHEFSHGVVSKAHGIKVKSSGIAFFGPIGGAFVEPDEKQLNKYPRKVQNAIFAAGPFSNVITAGIVSILMLFVLSPFIASVMPPVGITLSSITDGSPADIAHLKTGITYNSINGEKIISEIDFIENINKFKPGDTVTLGATTGESFNVILGEKPEDKEKGYLGVILTTVFQNKNTWWGASLLWIIEVFQWIFILNIGLGLANLLPLGPVDGGRMFQMACLSFFKKNRANLIWAKVSMVLFILLLILIFVPIIRAVLPSF